MAKPLLVLENIQKSFSVSEQPVTILKNLSLTIHEGELIAIVGSSGSGKSTLLYILGLLDKADQGKYLLDQQDISQLSESSLAQFRNQKIGFVFQQFYLLPRLTAEQNIALPLTYRKLSPTEIKMQVAKTLEAVEMSKFAQHYPTQLSGGQQQRIAIARALAAQARIILADEPTGSLDSQTGKTIMQLFLDLHALGHTIILVTHDQSIAAQCQRRITLVDGQIASHDV